MRSVLSAISILDSLKNLQVSQCCVYTVHLERLSQTDYCFIFCDIKVYQLTEHDSIQCHRLINYVVQVLSVGTPIPVLTVFYPLLHNITVSKILCSWVVYNYDTPSWVS